MAFGATLYTRQVESILSEAYANGLFLFSACVYVFLHIKVSMDLVAFVSALYALRLYSLYCRPL